MNRTIKALQEITGSLSSPSKMPCFSYNTPAKACKTGSILAKQEGTVCSNCYALKGRYLFDNVQKSLNNRLDKLKKSAWKQAMIELIQRREKSGMFRWHDSGDLQSSDHLRILFDIAEALPDIKFWLPTKEFKMVREVLQERKRPLNFIIRLSAFKVEQSIKSYAKRLGVLSSAVSNDKSKVSCVAYKQGNACGDCRACWDSTVDEVIYPEH